MHNDSTKKLAGIALFTAIVVVLQLLGSFIKFGPFSISLVLVPIVVGSAIYGPGCGAFLGFIFSVMVLFTDSSVFLAYSPLGTIVTVIAKGTLAGYGAGTIYKVLEKKNIHLATLLAAICAPVINTGTFVLGCFLFFIPLIETWSAGTNVAYYIIFGMIGTNFIIELLINVCLSSVITRLIKIGQHS